MRLFKSSDGFNVEIDPEVLLIKAFSDLYVDRKGDENIIRKEFAYIYFYLDIESDFMHELDDDLRAIDVKKHVNLPSTWYPDEYVLECCEVFNRLSVTISGKLLLSTRRMADKITKELDNIDLSKIDKNDKPVYDIKKIIDSSKAVPGLMEVINKAENEYIKGQKESSQNKGSKTKSIYEDM
jgi:hypothetical protein